MEFCNCLCYFCCNILSMTLGSLPSFTAIVLILGYITQFKNLSWKVAYLLSYVPYHEMVLICGQLDD